MKKLVMGCAVAGLILFSAKSEARASAFVGPPCPSVARQEKPEAGVAGWYGAKFHGNRTANGEIYDQNGYTAAHLRLPFGTIIKVTNLRNNRHVTLRINDRGPHVARRILDVTLAAAKRLGFAQAGTAPVRLEVMRYPKWLRSAYAPTAN